MNNTYNPSVLFWDEREISTLSDEQEIAISVASVVSGSLSVVGSSMIIWHSLRSKSKSSAHTSSYGRILLALSLSDIISSTAFILSPFLLPQDTSQRVWATGNDISCSFLGFWTQLANLAYWYNGVLGLYYFMTIRCSVPRQVFAKRYEPYIHGLSITFFLLSAAGGAVVGIYSEIEIGQGCWIGEYPAGCEARGDCIGHYFGYVFSAIPNLLVLLGLPLMNISIFCHIRRTLQRNLRYSVGDNSAMRAVQSKRLAEIATQGFLYVGSFYLSYTLFFYLRVMEGMGMDAQQEAQYFPILFLSALLAPLQGFFNVFIFVRPNYSALRKNFPELDRVWALKRALLEPDIAAFTSSMKSSLRYSSARLRESRQRDDATERGGGQDQSYRSGAFHSGATTDRAAPQEVGKAVLMENQSASIHFNKDDDESARTFADSSGKNIDDKDSMGRSYNPNHEESHGNGRLGNGHDGDEHDQEPDPTAQTSLEDEAKDNDHVEQPEVMQMQDGRSDENIQHKPKKTANADEDEVENNNHDEQRSNKQLPIQQKFKDTGNTFEDEPEDNDHDERPSSSIETV